MGYAAVDQTDLVQQVQQTTDLELLSRWFDAALTTPALEDFRRLVPPGDAPLRP